MDRRELIKTIAAGLALSASPKFLTAEELPPMEDMSIGPLWTRSLFVQKSYDYNRQMDKYIIGIRAVSCKVAEAARSILPYKKHVVGFLLPPGTPTPGLDALTLLLKGLRDAD